VPLAPRRDHRELRRECGIRQLEAHLVVPFPRAAVSERVRADPSGDLDLPAGNERPRHRRAEQVLSAVNGTGAQRRPDEVGHQLLAQVLDVALIGA